MKKILLLFTAVGSLLLTACNNDDDIIVSDGVGDGDTIAEVFQTAPITFNAGNDFSQLVLLDPILFPEDMVLVYRQGYDASANVNFWELIPRTVYFLDSTDEVDYDFNFTRNDIQIYMGANFNMNAIPAELTVNQVFRIVIIPGSQTGQAKMAPVNTKDYNAVIKAYGIDDSNIKTLSIK